MIMNYLHHLLQSVHTLMTFKVGNTTNYGDALVLGVIFIAALAALGATVGATSGSRKITIAYGASMVIGAFALPLILSFDWLDFAVVSVGLTTGLLVTLAAQNRGGMWLKLVAYGASTITVAFVLLYMHGHPIAVIVGLYVVVFSCIYCMPKMPAYGILQSNASNSSGQSFSSVYCAGSCGGYASDAGFNTSSGSGCCNCSGARQDF